MAATDGSINQPTGPNVARNDGSGISSNYINLPGPVRAGLNIAGAVAPAPWSAIPSAINLGTRVANLMETNRIRESLGAPDTNPFQAIGALMGLNNYASRDANQTIAAPGVLRNPLNGESPAVTMGGLYDAGNPLAQAWAGLMSLFGGTGYAEPRGAFTPGELMHRNAYASLPPGFFGPNGGINVWGNERAPVAPAVNPQGTGGTYAMRQGAVGAIPAPNPPKAAFTPGDIALDRNPIFQGSQTVNSAGAGPYGTVGGANSAANVGRILDSYARGGAVMSPGGSMLI